MGNITYIKLNGEPYMNVLKDNYVYLVKMEESKKIVNSTVNTPYMDAFTINVGYSRMGHALAYLAKYPKPFGSARPQRDMCASHTGAAIRELFKNVFNIEFPGDKYMTVGNLAEEARGQGIRIYSLEAALEEL